MKPIVVGVDGSEGARAALEFALAEAKLRDVPVRAVMTWQEPTMVYAGGFVPPVPPDEEFAAGAQRVLEEALAAVGGKGDVDVELVVRKGPAAKVLIEESERASLLVVGSRGYGGFHGLLVGSVSHQCAGHAHCPVTIVPRA